MNQLERTKKFTTALVLAGVTIEGHCAFLTQFEASMPDDKWHFKILRLAREGHCLGIQFQTPHETALLDASSIFVDLRFTARQYVEFCANVVRMPVQLVVAAPIVKKQGALRNMVARLLA